MIDVKEVLEQAKENLGKYNAFVARSPYAAKELTGEGRVIIETIIAVINEVIAEAEEVDKVVNEVEQIERNIEDDFDANEASTEEDANEPVDVETSEDPNEIK